MKDSQYRVGIIGAGATGGYLAARLSAAGIHVTVVARGRTLQVIRQDGFKVFEPDGSSFTASPTIAISPEQDASRVDALLFCTKSYDTAGAAQAVKPSLADADTILCLQNGVTNEKVLAAHFGREKILAGVLYIGVSRVGTAAIKCTAPARIILGPYEDSSGRTTHLDRLEGVLKEAGLEYETRRDAMTVKWQKFLFNCGLNPTTALTGQRLDQVLDTYPGRRIFEGLVDEAISVATAHGAPLSPNAREQVMETASQMCISSSMASDLSSGKPLELDAFSEYVTRLGRDSNLPTPLTDATSRLLRLLDHSGEENRGGVK